MQQTFVWKLLTFLSTVLLLLSPVLNMYSIFGDKYIDIYTGYLAIIIFWGARFFNKKPFESELQFPAGLRTYFIYSVIICFVSNLSGGGDVILSTLGCVLGILLYHVFWGTYKNDSITKAYFTIAVFAVGFHFFQNIIKWTSGYGVSGVIPWLSTSKGLAENAAYNQVYTYDRFSSFFSEPSHLAQFLIPLLILLLLDKNIVVKNRILMIVAITASLLLTQSGTAMMLAIPVVLFAILNIWKKKRHNFIISASLVTIAILAIAILVKYYLLSDIGSFVGERALEVTSSDRDNVGTSGFIRIWRGYFVFADFSPIEMLFGTSNHSNILAHVYNSHMELYLEDFGLTYFNGIQHILIHTGIIGFFLFTSFIIWLWKDNTVCGRCLIITFVVSMCIEANYGGSRMALFLLLAQSQKINFKKYETKDYYHL